MKKILSIALALSVSAAVYAQPPAGDAKTGDWYGSKITADNAVDISQVPSLLEKNGTVNGKLKAKVLDVCPKKGCWLKVAVNDSTTAFVKMKDYGFFLPLAIKGKTVVLDAETKWLITPAAEARHYAKDAKKSQAEIDAIKEDQKEIRLTASAIVVTDENP